MYAIVKTGGKQYRVQKGDVIKVEKITPEKENQKTYKFKEVLFLNDDKKLYVGAPFVKDAQVEAKIITDGRDDKVIVYKYKAKKDYRRKQGHRQPFTQLEITKIALKSAASEKTDPEAKPAEKKEAAPKKEAVKKETAVKKEAAPKKTTEKKETVKKEATKKDAAPKKATEKKAAPKKADSTKSTEEKK